MPVCLTASKGDILLDTGVMVGEDPCHRSMDIRETEGRKYLENYILEREFLGILWQIHCNVKTTVGENFNKKKKKGKRDEENGDRTRDKEQSCESFTWCFHAV